MKAVPLRHEVPVEFTWDTASLYASTTEWEASLQRVRAALPTLAAFQGRLGESPAALAEWFAQEETLLREFYKVYLYASCAHAVDTADQAAAAMTSRAGSLYAEVMAAVSFAEPELLALEPAVIRAMLDSDPLLAIFAHYLDELDRRRPHVRSAEVEQILGELMDAFGSASETHGILAEADLVFAPAHGSEPAAPPAEVTNGTLDALIVSPDRELRRSAYQSYADGHIAHQHAMANCLITGVKQDAFETSVRHYDSCLQAAIEPNHIPEAVYRNVLDTFQRNLPTWHRYWRVRRRALGLPELHVYDIKAPLSATVPVIPFAQAVDWISEGLAPLGEEYVRTLRRGVLEERWVDIYPNKGKAAGAFSSGFPGTHPFVLMSYTDDVYSLSTLAHELGHSMHSYLTWHTQPFVYSDYGIFVAEVASNFNQALVRQHLLDTQPDRGLQIALIEEAMSNLHRYFFLMPTLARFELELHERVERGEGLSAEILNTLMADLFAEGYGGEVVLDRAREGITWSEFHTHLYSDFYVYQYTTGIAGALALLAGVTAHGQPAVERYLTFLRSGASRYPLELLRGAGVDLTTPAPIQTAFDAMSDLITRLAELMGVSPE
jgi:oligoendopeptidase F